MSTTHKRRWFGTDGIRAPFGEAPLDRATVTALAHHLGRTLRERGGREEEAPEVILGGDTRASTPEIVGWLTAGLTAAGARVRSAGVIPTPGVAFLVTELGAASGIAVSASHNPAGDNGVKLVGADGFKWDPADEAALEERLLADPFPWAASGDAETPPPAAPAANAEEDSLTERYLEHLADLFPGELPLAGLRVALDAAHGAAAPYAADLFEALGAEVGVMGASPDGTNINDGRGSTHPEALARWVAEDDFDLGVAFDGDADRAVLVDETGTVRDGDVILYLWARDLARRGELSPPRIVATSMSNLGLERALAAHGDEAGRIEVERCGVGDREVVETLRRQGLVLGGEQSGHIVNLDLSTTGDGLLTALVVARLLAEAEEPLSELAAGFRRFPQVLHNVRVREKIPFADLPGVEAAAAEVEETLGAEGRLVLRYSGTEPLARIMIEGPDQTVIEELAGRIAAAIEGSPAVTPR